jgi:CheY-like chemotaxis protein
MSNKSTIFVTFHHLADNEKLIFKLIFSVSERAISRTHQYRFVDEGQGHASLIISGTSNISEDNNQALVVQVCDRNEEVEGPVIHRPLIATRVLSTLDRLVEEHDVSQGVIASGENAAAQSQIEDVENDDQHGDVESGGSQALVEFSISEEEASELAIVHDDTLANPANREEQQTQDESPTSEVEPLVQGLPQEEHIGDRDVAPSLTRDEETIQTALVVDDSASVRKQLEIELDLFEVSVDYAEDAERALDLLAKKHYDVAFLDVVLPDMDGFSICKKIKDDKDSKSTKVIMLTGKASHADKVRGTLAGCDSYLVKPVGRTTFQATVKKFLKPIENIQVMEA